MPKMPSIIIDTREQYPFVFQGIRGDYKEKFQRLNVPTLVSTLPTGDYSLANFEHLIAIERKSPEDLYATLTWGRKRFERELKRLDVMEVAAVVVEGSLENLLLSPPTEACPKSIIRSIIAWQQRYPMVHWWMCETRRLAELITFRILQRYWIDKCETKYGLESDTAGDIIAVGHCGGISRARIADCWPAEYKGVGFSQVDGSA